MRISSVLLVSFLASACSDQVDPSPQGAESSSVVSVSNEEVVSKTVSFPVVACVGGEREFSISLSSTLFFNSSANPDHEEHIVSGAMEFSKSLGRDLELVLSDGEFGEGLRLFVHEIIPSNRKAFEKFIRDGIPDASFQEVLIHDGHAIEKSWCSQAPEYTRV